MTHACLSYETRLLYLFIRALINDAGSNSDFVALNGGKDLEGSGRSVMYGTVPPFSWGG
jgi:hypothetical protein